MRGRAAKPERSGGGLAWLAWLAWLGAAGALFAGCGGDEGPVGEVWAGDAAAPRADAHATLLRTRFPAHAEHVLRSGRGLVRVPGGFGKAPPEGRVSARTELDVRLPEEGGEAVRLQVSNHALGSHTELTLREVGMRGGAQLAEETVSYARDDGVSFWTATERGVEEWLLLEPTLPGAERQLVWRAEGGSFVPGLDGTFDVVDEVGVRRLRVSAPVAFAEDGESVPLRLEASGGELRLVVAQGDRRVLVDPGWSATDAMAASRSLMAGLVLPDGRALVTGGGPDTAEIFDPASETWSPAGTMSEPRMGHTATLLPSGQVLVVGGQGADLYDPAAGTWTPTAAPNVPRSYHTANLLLDGRVLIAAGFVAGAPLASAEVFDPATGAWALTGPMLQPLVAHGAGRLADGRVLLALGSNTGAADQGSTTSQIYDPTTNTWSFGPPTGTGIYQPSTITLQDGRILFSGGFILVLNKLYPQSSVLLMDPNGASWSFGPSMQVQRGAHSLSLLPDGKVLAVGGKRHTFPDFERQVERFDPVAGTWTTELSLPGMGVGEHFAATLGNGLVLVAGGSWGNGAELQLGEPCQSTADCLSGFCVEGVCCESACSGSSCLHCSQATGSPWDGACYSVSACDDGNPCTVGDACNNGVCAGTPVVCPSPGVCGVSSCDPMTGSCVVLPAPDGSPCSDGSACTSGEVCSSGVCTNGALLVCSPVDECHQAGQCSPNSGDCSNPKAPNGTPCTGGACFMGFCVLDDAGAGGSGGGGGDGGADAGVVDADAGVVDADAGAGAGGEAADAGNFGGGDGAPSQEPSAADVGGCQFGGAPRGVAGWMAAATLIAFARRRSSRAG